MYWRNIVDFCKQKINLDSEVQLLQGKLKFAEVSGRNSVSLRANVAMEAWSQFINLFFFDEEEQIFSGSCKVYESGSFY
jgi:hypothetical protein